MSWIETTNDLWTLNAIAKAINIPEEEFHRLAGYASMNKLEKQGIIRERKDKEWVSSLKLLLLEAGFNEQNTEHIVITAQSVKFAQDFNK